MAHSKPATMVQIAERAGVALSTVSYVLSGKRPVSQEMRERVLAAIEELDYRPHGPARALASGASHTIALFLPWSQWQLLPVQQTFVAGAAQATSASDYALLLSTAATDPETITRLVARGRADGVILMETLLNDPRVERLQADGYPFVLIGRTGDTTGISYVDLDYPEAIETSLAHLARLGHTCVALFNFGPDLLKAGYTSALLARDLFEQRAPDFGIRGIHISCSPEASEMFATAAQLLRSEPACTAAITTSWQFPGVLSALRAAGLRVPDDFSLVSVLAAEFAEMLTPSLTGVQWPAFEAGRMAAEMLIEQLTAQEAPARQHLISAELVVRESTGPVPRSRAALGPRRGDSTALRDEDRLYSPRRQGDPRPA
jgi:DNA-binding LacI/PurR family transcriptional regulator